MRQKKDYIRKPDMVSEPDIRLTDEMRRLPLKKEGCVNLPRVKCPVKDGEYCLYDITRITPSETDYACPSCGQVVKKDVFTTGGWKTLVLDRRHEV
jgi:hypothetical protein